MPGQCSVSYPPKAEILGKLDDFEEDKGEELEPRTDLLDMVVVAK